MMDERRWPEPLASFLAGIPVAWYADNVGELQSGDNAVLVTGILEDVADYRGVIRSWFDHVRVGGHLVILVPHAFLADRQLAMPSRRRPKQRRLYTARSLVAEVEEALIPNSYRIRWLGDLDNGYDYVGPAPAATKSGWHHAGIVLEKIDIPGWALEVSRAATIESPLPLFVSEQVRVGVEFQAAAPKRILVLKLDHLGDFLISLDAMRRLRALFSEAHVTVVVGSWNAAAASESGLFDEVIAFDAFPANAAEQVPDVAGHRALFSLAVAESYDLAIDLRVDGDTRALLEVVNASCRAAIGSTARYPFLDIALPIDPDLGAETAASWRDGTAADFSAGPSLLHSRFAISAFDGLRKRSSATLVWGPYWELDAGDHVFEPYLEFVSNNRRPLVMDIALDARRILSTQILPGDPLPQLRFSCDRPGRRFEFRLWAADRRPVPQFQFFGGRLCKRGGGGALHQAEWQILLVELVVSRWRQGFAYAG